MLVLVDAIEAYWDWLTKMFLLKSVHLLDKTLILSKPAIHCGEESTEDNLPTKKGNNVKRKSERKGTNRAQEK